MNSKTLGPIPIIREQLKIKLNSKFILRRIKKLEICIGIKLIVYKDELKDGKPIELHNS